MNRKLFVVASVVTCGLVGWVAAPRAIKSYVEHEYPYVQVGRVSLGWPVIFYEVEVTKGSIKAHLREVRATPKTEDTVEVFGGDVQVTLKSGSSNPSVPNTSRKIVAQDLVVRVSKDEHSALLTGVTVDDGYAFKTAEANYKGHRVEAINGRMGKDRKRIEVEQASMLLELPFEIPRMESKGRLTLKDIKGDVLSETVTVDSAIFDKIEAKEVQVSRKDGEVALHIGTVRADHPWIAVEPVTLTRVEVRTSWPISVIHGKIGDASFTVDPVTKSIQGSNSCQAWLTALPQPLPEALRVPPENFSGTLTFDVQTQPKPKFVLKFDCKYKCSEEPIKTLRSGKFQYQAYNAKNNLFTRTVGRNTQGWVSLTDLPPYTPKAFITLEDPGFTSHRGIITQALHNSLVDNLKLGKFFRGGSTITMQLAKNLWLRRHKTISRKVYESLLAIAVESCLSKEEILELYINVVEYGPNLYGIGPATSHYFSKGVSDLSPEESFYLAMLLPNPKQAVPPEQGGLDRARGLMKRLVNSGLLADYLIPIEAPPVDWEVND